MAYSWLVREIMMLIREENGFGVLDHQNVDHVYLFQFYFPKS